MLGAQKAAAVLLAVDRTTAKQLLRHFTAEELRLVTVAAARLGNVSNQTLEMIAEQFATDFSERSTLLGDEGQARALLSDAVTPDLITSYLQQGLGGGQPDVWKATAALPEAYLSTFLKRENPLIVTYVLSRLDSQVAAKIVATLPRDLRNQVLCRLIAPPPIAPASLQVLEGALREVLLGGPMSASDDDGRARIAEIINSLDPTEAEDVMKALEVSRPQDAVAVRAMLFSFQDLPRLAQRARALLFDKLPTDIVVTALRGTDAEFRESSLSAMASRSRRLVESELANPSITPPAEIAKARKEIVKLVLMMASRSEIELPSQDIHDGIAA